MDKTELPISDFDSSGHKVDFITFKELVNQITGVSFDEIYKDYLIHGDKNE